MRREGCRAAAEVSPRAAAIISSAWRCTLRLCSARRMLLSDACAVPGRVGDRGLPRCAERALFGRMPLAEEFIWRMSSSAFVGSGGTSNEFCACSAAAALALTRSWRSARRFLCSSSTSATCLAAACVDFASCFWSCRALLTSMPTAACRLVLLGTCRECPTGGDMLAMSEIYERLSGDAEPERRPRRCGMPARRLPLKFRNSSCFAQ